MAGAALRAQRSFPLVHDLVYLVSGHVLRQHLQICRGRSRRMCVTSRRRSGRLLSDGYRTGGGKRHCKGAQQGRNFQAQNSSRVLKSISSH
jgi:hypothetical protein